MAKLMIFGTRLLVDEYKKEIKKDLEKTASGLFIPQAQETPMDRLFRGKVIGIGDEVTKVKPDQEIIYDRMQPAPFVVDGVTYIMIDESSIIGAWTE